MVFSHNVIAFTNEYTYQKIFKMYVQNHQEMQSRAYLDEKWSLEMKWIGGLRS